MKLRLELDNETVNNEMIFNAKNHLENSCGIEKINIEYYGDGECYASFLTLKKISNFDKIYCRENFGVIISKY